MQLKIGSLKIVVDRVPNTPFIQDDQYRQLAADLISPFENLLDEKKIVIPSEDREGATDESCIYGTEYYSLDPVPSDSVPGKDWEVAEWEDGTFTCNCPSFCRGKDKLGQALEVRKPCKHIQRVLQSKRGIEA